MLARGRTRPVVALALTFALGSCARRDAWRETWSFSATRATWGSDDWRVDPRDAGPRSHGLDSSSSDTNAAIVGVVLVGPLLFDVVLLPITLPHDLLVAD